jgi:hypothetical protein
MSSRSGQGILACAARPRPSPAGHHPRLLSPRQAGQVPSAPLLRQVLLAALAPVAHPPPATMRPDVVVAQLALPLRFGGFGLRLTTPLAAIAAFLAAARAAPLSALQIRETPLAARWAALHDAASSLWTPELRVLDAPLLAQVLLQAQRENGRHPADRRIADLLAFASPSFVGTRFRARLLCMPTSFHLVGHHAHLLPPPPVRLGRHLLGSPLPGPAGRAGKRPRPPVRLQVPRPPR